MIYYKGDMSTHPDCCRKHLDSSASPDGSEHGCPRMLSGLVYLNDIDSRKNGGRTIFIGRDSRAYEPSEGGALLFSNFKCSNSKCFPDQDLLHYAEPTRTRDARKFAVNIWWSANAAEVVKAFREGEVLTREDAGSGG